MHMAKLLRSLGITGAKTKSDLRSEATGDAKPKTPSLNEYRPKLHNATFSGESRSFESKKDIVSKKVSGKEPVSIGGYPAMFKSAIDIDLPVLICSKKLKTMGDVIGWFRAQGIGVTLCESLDVGKRVPSQLLTRHSFIFVDIDSFGGIDECYDCLVWIRENALAVPVVILSHDFLVDDFSCERLPLTDVSLRLPVSFSSLELSLMIARQNNYSWQLRFADAMPYYLLEAV